MKARKSIRTVCALLLTVTLICGSLPTALAFNSTGESVTLPDGGTYIVSDFLHEGDFDVYYLNSEGTRRTTEPTDSTYGVSIRRIREDQLLHSAANLYIPDTYYGYPVVRLEKADARNHYLGIRIPASVTEIADPMFSNCPYLEWIEVDTENTHFYTVDGVLYKGNLHTGLTHLVCYPQGKKDTSFTTFAGARYIDDQAFYGNAYLRTLTIAVGQSSLTVGEIRNCTALETLIFGEGPLFLNAARVENCPALQTVHYSASNLRDMSGYPSVDLSASGATALTVCSAVYTATLQDAVLAQGYAYRVCGDAHTFAQQEVASPEQPAGIEDVSSEELFWFIPCYQQDAQGGYVTDEYGTPRTIGYSVCGLEHNTLDIPVRVTIPATHAGLPVLEIQSGFSSMIDNLIAVHIPSTVQSIQPFALTSGSTLTEITVDADSTFFKVIDNVLYTADGKTLVAYPQAKEDTEFTIPQGTERLADNRICWSPNLRRIELPSSFTDGQIAETLGTAQNLEAVYVDAANPALYADSSGVLYDKNQSALLYYPALGPADYTLPQCVSMIADGAIGGQNLQTLRIPDGATETPIVNLSSCVYHVSGVICLHIPESVTTIRFTGRGSVRICSTTRASQAAAYAAVSGTAFYICNADHTELRLPTDDDPPAPALNTDNTFDFNFLYETDENGAARVTGVSICGLLQTPDEPFVLTIPAECCGFPVLKVSFSGIWEKNHGAKVTKLELPATVRSLDISPFGAASSLNDSFTGLAEITVDEANRYLCAVNGVLFDKAMTKLLLYPAAKADTSYAIPDGVADVASGNVIDTNRTIRNLTLPASFTGGANAAWFNVLRKLRKLQSITVDPDNPAFSSDDHGVLFNADMTKMILYPPAAPAEVYTIPMCVEDLYSSYTFYQPEHLRVLCVAEGAIKTPYGKIATTAPQYVHIPSSVVSVNFTSISKTYQTICSDSADSRAAAYAKRNGIPFALCNADHTQFTPVDPDDIPTYAVSFTFITEKDENGVTHCTGVSVAGPAETHPDAPYTLTIPETCYGLPVRQINFNKWSDKAIANVTRIEIPKTVETLVGFPVNVAANCTKLSCITVDGNNPYLCSKDGVLFDKAMTELIWYPAAKSDASYAIPDGVQCISYAESFSSNRCLEHLSLPASFTQFGTTVSRCFSGLYNLESFSVDPNNPDYSSDANGVLYNADKTIVYIYPCAAKAETFTIPASVIRFGFYKPTCMPRYLRVLCIADGKETAPVFSVHFGDPLQYLHIPSSVTTINETNYNKLDKSVTICSDAADCAAAVFARDNGYTFLQCSGHDASVLPDDPPDPPTEPLALTVSGGTAKPGELVRVTVELTGNPGIVAARLHLHYDPDVLTLTGVQDGGLLDTAAFVAGMDLSAIPYTVLWDDSLSHTDHTATGTLVTYTFRISENAAAGTTQVALTYDEDSTFNVDLQNVACSITNGAVTVVTRIAGDANGDGTLDLKDVVLLRRFLAGGWNVTVRTENADVNGDGVISLKDCTLLSRSLAGGWNVTLQ